MKSIHQFSVATATTILIITYPYTCCMWTTIHYCCHCVVYSYGKLWCIKYYIFRILLMLVDAQILLAMSLIMLLTHQILAHHIRPPMCIKMGYYHLRCHCRLFYTGGLILLLLYCLGKHRPKAKEGYLWGLYVYQIAKLIIHVEENENWQLQRKE